MGEREEKVSWGQKALDFVVGSSKSLVAFVGGLAVFLVGLPDVTPFIGDERARGVIQLILVIATAVATWYAKYQAIPVGRRSYR